MPVNDAALELHRNGTSDSHATEENDEGAPLTSRSARIASNSRGIEGETTMPSATQTPVEQSEYVVDKIVNHRTEDDGKLTNFVKWYGYPSSKITWEPITNLRHSMITQYFRRKRMQCSEDLNLAMEG